LQKIDSYFRYRYYEKPYYIKVFLFSSSSSGADCVVNFYLPPNLIPSTKITIAKIARAKYPRISQVIKGGPFLTPPHILLFIELIELIFIILLI
jgi:hypothetical protein